MTDRELDILIAKEVMGLNVLGEVAVMYYPGDRHIASIDEVDDYYDSEIDIAYLKKCSCDDGSEKDVFGHYGDGCLDIVKRYSTSLAAFDVVNKLENDGYAWNLRHGKGQQHGKPYHCQFSKLYLSRDSYGKTVPMAICLAAIKIFGHTE